MYTTQAISTTISEPVEASPRPEIQPLPLWQSSLLFFVPALAMALSFHLGRPALEALGVPAFKSFLAALTVPLSLMFAAALVAYNKVEGRPLNWAAFSERMRFPRLRIKDILLAVGLFLLASTAYAMFNQIGLALIQAGLIPIPNGLPALVDPRVSFDLAALDRLAGGSLAGRWDLAALFIFMFIFNMVGEELWWRGYILPRQELVHGKRTWLLHGLQWTFFHAFKWWDMIGLLPVCLILSFSAQKLKNNWPILIAHSLVNGISVVLVVAKVAGAI